LRSGAYRRNEGGKGVSEGGNPQRRVLESKKEKNNELKGSVAGKSMCAKTGRKGT